MSGSHGRRLLIGDIVNAIDERGRSPTVSRRVGGNLSSTRFLISGQSLEISSPSLEFFIQAIVQLRALLDGSFFEAFHAYDEVEKGVQEKEGEDKQAQRSEFRKGNAKGNESSNELILGSLCVQMGDDKSKVTGRRI